MSSLILRCAPIRPLPSGPVARVIVPYRKPKQCFVVKWLQSRGLSASAPRLQEAVPLRKHLKDEAKRKKAAGKIANDGRSDISQQTQPRLDEWELTVGIEIHAELNTAHKLFSSALAESHTNGEDEEVDSSSAAPNSQVALFDAAMPGAQPRFQKATLLPAIRAALALGCEVQRKSGWDRKHYFHWDQPNGYQITQYYSPFAKDGAVVLNADDGVPATDLDANGELRVGVKQVQMEQDTAKTIAHGGSYHVDLNRAGLPLIEVISLPHIHSPQAAAAYVRKVQGALKAVDACTTGMEAGGLRADVNVSVKKKGEVGKGNYSGVEGLGQRTEIKNLSSFRAVEDAIVAERDRQIALLESGGTVEGETRGWSLGDTATRRLRGKEGEVDYRYMPDADLPPLFIGSDLVQVLRDTLPELPDRTVARVVEEYGLTAKDARTLTNLDDGDRLEFMEETVAWVVERVPQTSKQAAAKAASNWILMELGGLLTTSNTSWQQIRLTSQELADLIVNLLEKQITARVAKQLLASLVENKNTHSRPSVDTLIDEGDVRLQPLSEEEYRALAQKVIDGNPDMVAAVVEKGQKGKLMWFVGQMVRNSKEGTVEPQKAREMIEALLLPG